MFDFSQTGFSDEWRDWGRDFFNALDRDEGLGLVMVAAGSRLTPEQATYFDELIEDLLYLQTLYYDRDGTDDQLSAMRAQVLAANAIAGRLVTEGVWVMWRPGTRDVVVELKCVR